LSPFPWDDFFRVYWDKWRFDFAFCEIRSTFCWADFSCWNENVQSGVSSFGVELRAL
jgi:hypothetical protein